MQKILAFNSEEKHYIADACIVWCFDDRFSAVFEAFVKQKNFDHVDLIKIAGGAKDLSSPDQESKREYILDQIEKSVLLHKSKEIILMMHNECGACGGNCDQEYYATELNKAGEIISNKFPEIPVLKLFARFDSLNSI